MVTRRRGDGARLSRDYVGSSAGAPPVPPPGGYRHERRFPDRPIMDDLLPETPPPRRPRAHPVGWVALLIALVFGVVLAGAVISGGVDLVLGPTLLAMQAAVIVAIVAALCVRRARVFGAVALTIALVCNVGTAAAVAAVVAPPGSGIAQAGDDRSAYPGIRGLDPQRVLAAPSLEEVREHTNALSEQIRTSLSDEFGFTWARITDATTRPERNGYGGESLLQRYTSPTWRTEQPIHGYEQKLEVMAAINRVLAAHGEYHELYPLNEPDGSIDPLALESLYGSADSREQHTWEYVTQRVGVGGAAAPDRPLLYATLLDLTNDDDGDLRARERAERAPDEPIEGLNLMFLAPELLAESDRDAFEDGTR